MKRSVCVLVSGGLDSCVMLAGLAKRYRVVHPLYIRHGLRWEDAELRHLRRFLCATSLPPVTVLRLPVCDLYGAHWSLSGKNVPGTKSRDEAVYLPGRNLLLLAKAAVFCAQRGIGTIAIGTLRGNPFADTTPRFFRDFARMSGVRVIAPLRGLTKEQVFRRGRGLPLHLTFSCINPQHGSHCGRCNKCEERRCVFQGVGE